LLRLAARLAPACKTAWAACTAGEKWRCRKAAGGVLTAQQAPHRPGTAPGTAGSDRVDSFFRLFGDADGDGAVDGPDRALFRSAFKTRAGEAGYLWYFDFDGDGAVDGRDKGQFNRRFGHS
jgi:hypothetical protein